MIGGRYRAPHRAVATGEFAHVPWALVRRPLVLARLVAMAAAVRVRLAVWTVDDPATMHVLLDAGVDAVITDRPDLLREVLVSRGTWTPHPPDRLLRPTCPKALPGGPVRAR